MPPDNHHIALPVHQPPEVEAHHRAARIRLSHADIWVDAALVDSLVAQLMMVSDDLKLKGGAA